MHTRPSKKPKRPRDLNQLAYQIVQEATGQEEPSVVHGEFVFDSNLSEREKNPAAVALGKLGGSKGGIARAKKLSPKRRREIAKRAAKARWNKKPEP